MNNLAAGRWILLIIALTACGGGADRSDLSAAGTQDPVAAAAAAEGFQQREVAAQGFALVRAVLDKSQAVSPFPVLSRLPGCRSFVCAYGGSIAPLRNICGTGTGASLEASLRAASERLRERAASHLATADDWRIKIDVVSQTRAARCEEQVVPADPADVGRLGFWIDRRGQISYLVPSEVIERGIYTTGGGRKGLDVGDLWKAARQRNVALPPLDPPFDYETFRTVAWVESSQDSGQHLRLDRLHPASPPDLDADLLLERSAMGADYLVAALSQKGRFRYHYSVAEDRSMGGYNMLRHAGTTYALLQAYRRVGDPVYLAAAERAIFYLLEKCQGDTRRGPYGGGEVLMVVDGGKVKLGGAALALLALDEYVAATGDSRTFKRQSLALGRFLVAMQKADGEFISFPGMTPEDPPLPKVSAYYPGEAILALMRLYRWNPDPTWLAVARRGARWLIEVRDADLKTERLPQDHWLMMALGELYEVTENTRFLEHSLRLARAVEHEYLKNAARAGEVPDYLGGYFDPPRSNPAAIRAEGLVAVQASCEAAGKNCDWIDRVLRDTIRHQLLVQYTPDTLWWASRPERAIGGWPAGLLDTSIRIDTVQHNISALLGMEQRLR